MAEMTAKQKMFVAAYSGNATEAARAAGYSSKTAYSQGQRLLKNAEVAEAIREREGARTGALVATREARQEFWTAVMMNEELPMKERLRASELLGRSEGDFLEKSAVQVEAITPASILENVYRNRAKAEALAAQQKVGKSGQDL